MTFPATACPTSRTVYDPEGKPVGVIVITAEHEALFRTFQKLVSDGAKVYILDQNGIIICHTNAQRVGNWMTSMEAFQEEYGYNSYRIIQRGMRTSFWQATTIRTAAGHLSRSRTSTRCCGKALRSFATV